VLKTLFIQVIIPITGTCDKVIGIHLGVCFIFLGYIFFREYSFRGANRHTRSTVDTRIGVNEEIRAPIRVIFGTRNNAIYGADFYTVTLTGAELSDSMSH
jgi:hypothetical protein